MDYLELLRFASGDLKAVLTNINGAINEGKSCIENSQAIFITLGSAWVYRHLEANRIVGNCHKIPGKEFQKELLSFQDIHLTLRHLVEVLQKVNKELKVIFTLSPIRHWRDGAVENQRSKALLHAAIQEAATKFESCSYFPSYEIMMDDLHDYRFYGTDMLHPNEQALNYIWQRFSETYFSEEAIAIMKEMQKIRQAMTHRAFDPESNSYQRFVERQLKEIDTLKGKYPEIDLVEETMFFQALRLG